MSFKPEDANQKPAPASDAKPPHLYQRKVGPVDRPPLSLPHVMARNPKVEAFFDDLVAVYRKHGMSLAHEDHEGGFIVMDFDEDLIRWLRAADDLTGCGV